MIVETLRLLAVVCLIIIVIYDDFPFYAKIKTPQTQLILAILVVLAIFYDPTFGLIMSVVLLMIYYEIYKVDLENIKKQDNEKKEAIKKNKETYSNLSYDNIQQNEFDFISPQLLDSAQNNIFDTNNYQKEFIGFEKGFNDEKVYGSQGLNTGSVNLVGYTKDIGYEIMPNKE